MRFSKHPRLFSTLLALLFIAPAMADAARAQGASPPVRQAIPLVSTDRPLGIGDQVTFRVVEDKDPPVRLVVTDSGELDIPYLGRVKAAGKTVSEVRANVKSALEQDYCYQATVQLALDQLASTSSVVGTVYISGQVRQPGPQELTAGEQATAGRLILKAGGLAEFADGRKVKIVRKAREGEQPRTEVLDLKEVLERGRTELDVVVSDGDLIIVPQRLINW